MWSLGPNLSGTASVTNREPGIKQCSTAYYEKPVSPSGSPLLTAAPAFADGPSADFKPNREARVFISRNKTVRLEQYAKKQEDGAFLYQFWTFDRKHRHPFPLNPGEISRT
jgi:hypothetical protein